MIVERPLVSYKRVVSDLTLILVLDRIASFFGRDILVHSGDRDHRPKGSPKGSLHLKHRAADFHVSGLPDAIAFQRLRLNKDLACSPLDSAIMRFQVIHHGPYTETEGEHLHLGHFPAIKELVMGPGVTFLAEGLTPQTRGKYNVIAS